MIIVDIISILLSTVLLSFSVKRLLLRKNSTLDLCFILYYLMQVLPMVLQLVTNDMPDIKEEAKVMYDSMLDDTVSIIYDIYVIITSIVLFIFSRKRRSFDIHKALFEKAKNIHASKYLMFFLIMMIYAPLIVGFIFAPDKNVYTTFSYFYTNEVDKALSVEYIYHSLVMMRCTQISLLFILLSYFFKRKRSVTVSFFIVVGIILCTWFEGKRGILVYALLGILVLDYVKNSFTSKKMVLRRLLFFAFIIFGYFFSYSQITEKGSESSFFREYTCYFARLSAEKVAIYDVINTDKILEYPGQSLLFDLLFFVPRSMWEDKPVMYCKYFTGYVYTGDGSEMLGANLHVNIWAEYVSNFGLLGHFVALFLLVIIVQAIDKSKSISSYISGALFVFVYLMFGFESIVIILYVVWIFSTIVASIKNKKRSVKHRLILNK